MSSGSHQCVLRPYEGILVMGVGRVGFGMTADDVQAVLGPGRPFRRYNCEEREWPNELYYQDEPILSVRFDFDDLDRQNEFIEFLSPRAAPPVLDGWAIAGPTLRQAVELVVELGYEPDEGAVDDLRSGSIGKDGSGTDSVDFPSIGLSLWTSMSTETDECGTLGEHVLDTVGLWRHGYRS